MKFSIVTISYNQGKYLRECIESVLNQQENADIEYIVVDPGSTDESRKIIKSYKQIIKVFELDKGPADGLNKGFQLATGDYFGFINSDDYFLPGAINKIEKEIRRSGASFITGKGYIKLLNKNYRAVMPTKLSLNNLLLRGSVIFQPSTFFSRDLFKKTGGFNCNNHTCWDYEFYIDLLAKNNIQHHIFDEAIAVFRLHLSSITGSGRLKELCKSDVDRLFKKYKKRNYNIIDKILTLLHLILNKLFR
jgi:glycosyltransferase involved in cell wall biosynthesis